MYRWEAVGCVHFQSPGQLEALSAQLRRSPMVTPAQEGEGASHHVRGRSRYHPLPLGQRQALLVQYHGRS